MNTNSKTLVSAWRALVLSALLVAIALPLTAGEPMPVSTKQIDSMRTDLLRIADQARRLARLPQAKEDLGAAKLRIEQASDDELAQLYRQAGPYLAYYSDVLDSFVSSLEDIGTTLVLKSDGFPEAPYPTGDLAATYGGIFDVGSLGLGDEGDPLTSLVSYVFSVTCSDGGDAKTERLSYQARFTAKQAILVGELVRDVLGRICDQDGYVLGAGGNLSLFCIASDLVYQLARPLEEFPAICDALIDSAEIEGAYDRLGHLHDDLETAQASLDDLDGDLADHDDALATHDDAVYDALDDSVNLVVDTIDGATTTILTRMSEHDADVKAILAANRAFFLRTFVERSLFRELQGNATPPSEVRRLATLYLPGAYGGNLELVRQVVGEAITGVNAAGEDSNGAASYLAAGDQAYSAGSYKEAWDHYADAYIEALRCPKSDPACRK